MARNLAIFLFIVSAALTVPSSALAGAAVDFNKAVVRSAEDEEKPVKMTSLAQLRAAAKLPAVAVNQDPALNSLLDQYISAIEALPAEGPGYSDEPNNLVQCGCYLYQKSGEGFNFISPTQFAQSRGQAGSYGAWTTTSFTLDNMPQEAALELFLDGRLTALAAHSHTFTGGQEALIIFAKLADEPAPVRVLENPLNSYDPLTLIFTSPDKTKKFRIDQRSGGQWLGKYYGSEPRDFGTYQGFAGLRLNYFADGDNHFDLLSLGWGARYRIVAGDSVGEFTTKQPTPPRKSWFFHKSMKRSHKAIFRRAISKMSPTYRAILKKIAPYTKIKTHSGGGYSIAEGYDTMRNTDKTLPFTVSFARGHLMMKNFRNEVIAHELAHIIDFSGFDDQAYREMKKSFKKSKKWRNCSSSNYKPSGGLPRWPCAGDTELIADQLAYGALNKRSGVGGYGHPRLISARAAMRLTKKYYQMSSPFSGKLLTDSDWRDIEADPDDLSLASRQIVIDTFPESDR